MQKSHGEKMKNYNFGNIYDRLLYKRLTQLNYSNHDEVPAISSQGMAEKEKQPLVEIMKKQYPNAHSKCQNSYLKYAFETFGCGCVCVCGKDGNEIEVVGNTHTKKQ